MTLSEQQQKALKMLSFGVSLNLRRYFTKPTVQALQGRGLIVEHWDTRGNREHSITDDGMVEVSKSK